MAHSPKWFLHFGYVEIVSLHKARRPRHHGMSRMIQTFLQIHDAEYLTQVVVSDEALESAIQDLADSK